MTLAGQPLNTLTVASYVSVAIGIASVTLAVLASTRALHLYRRRQTAGRSAFLQVKVTEADYLMKLVDLLDRARSHEPANVHGPADTPAKANYEQSLDQVEQGLKELAGYHRSLHPDLSFRVSADADSSGSAEDCIPTTSESPHSCD